MSKIYDFSEVSVLLAEDNDFMAGLLKSILSALRIGRVHRVKNGSEAKDLLDARLLAGTPHSGFGIDLVISDWLMEPVDGLELLQWIRSHPSDSIHFLPFIMLTAYPEVKRVVTARDAGNTEFLRKPVSVADILSRLVEVIERPRPFIRTESYFGPDRRRRIGKYDGPERRQPREETQIIPPQRASRKATAR